MNKVPSEIEFEVIDLNRRYTKEEMERISKSPCDGIDGLKFIAVQQIEEAEASYIIDPSNFGSSSDWKYA